MTGRPPDKEPSCINCGGAGHWAIACPEPTRQVPAGLQGPRPADERHRGGGKHGNKKHKGPIVNKYSPPVPAPSHTSHAPYTPAFGGYGHPDPSYPPPSHAPHGHYGGPIPPPPGPPPPSYSPPPHLGGPPHGVPPHASPYGPPGPYATPPRPPPPPAPYGQPPGYPSGPPPPPPPHPFRRQHHTPHHQYYQQHPQGHHYPPPSQYDYSPPQAHPFPQPPYAPPPPPPPPSSSPGVGNSFHGPPPHLPPAGPPHVTRPPGPPAHHSPTPPGSTPHGPPPSLPSLPNIGGPGSLIRILPPKPTVQVPPADRGQGRRKDRNKSWRNKRNKDKHPSNPANTNGDSGRKNEAKSTSKTTKPVGAERRREGKSTKAHGAAEDGKVGRGKSDPGDTDAASKISDKPEEGEILDEDQEWDWDEKTIFKEPDDAHPADAVAGPLPSEYTEHVLIPPAWNAKCITSKFVNPDNKDDFCRPVKETLLWDQYKNTVPFGSLRSSRPPLTAAELHELLGTRRSSLNPGPRREPKVPSRRQGSPKDREEAKYPDHRRATSRGRSISPEGRTPQQDRRPVIDSYRPNYERGRRSRSSSRDRRRRRNDESPPRGQASPGSSAQFFKLPLEDRSRDSSPESDLNSLENELLGLSPKSPSEDENKKAAEKKAEETKKRPNDDAIPKSKRRRVQVDSAFGRRW